MKLCGSPEKSNRHTVLAVMICAVCVFMAFTVTAFAHSTASRYFTCRVCGHTFVDAVSVTTSFFGIQLDFMRTGPSPQPWRVNQCPQCKFIVNYGERRPGGGTYAANEFEELRRFVLSEEYQSLPEATPSYGYIVKIVEHVGGASDFAMADLYRGAFWQTRYMKNGGEPFAGEYLRAMLACYERCARADHPDLDEKIISRYMKVEANRRLGQFGLAGNCREEALAVLESVDRDGLDEGSKKLFATIDLFLEQQQQHIANRDSGAKEAVFPKAAPLE